MVIQFPYLFDGHYFKDAVELADYNNRVAARNRALEGYQEDTSGYTGTIVPESLTVEDWRVHAQSPFLWNRKDVFTKPEAGLAKDPVDGRTLHQGDLAQVVDINTYEGVLKQFFYVS
jgi:hypothetical protein